jgi:hypothetical protein
MKFTSPGAQRLVETVEARESKRLFHLGNKKTVADQIQKCVAVDAAATVNVRRRLGLQAMSRKLKHWGYYVMATRETAYPPSWRWQIVRRGKSMGVRIDGGGFTTYEAARLAGSRALTEFLEQFELESFRID